MANLESQSFAQSEKALSQEVPKSLKPLFTAEEEREVWCSITKMSVAADRRNNGMTGQKLDEFHGQILSDRCDKIDLGKWVAEDEANREANHRAIEEMKAKERNKIKN